MSSKKNMKKGRTNAVRSSAGVNREMRLASSVNRIFTKRIVASSSIQSNGSGFIAATSMVSTAQVTGVGDFSVIAGVYSNYRVKALRVTVHPFYVANTTSVVVSPLIAVVPWRSGLTPTTFQGFCESSEVRYCSGYKSYTFETSNKNYPDGKLWNPTNAVIASADSYGLSVMGQSTVAGTATTNVWAFTAEYLCEFTVEN